MGFKHKSFVSAVVYVHNDSKGIKVFLKRLYETLNENFEKFEIICANDASNDNSKEIIQELAGSFEKRVLSIVNMGYYHRMDATMHAGVDLAIGDFVFEFDEITMDYESGLIMQVYNHSLKGFDIVSCGKAGAHVFSRLFYTIYNRNSDAQNNIRSETFRVLSRRAINRVHSMSMNLPYRKALYSNCGLDVDFIYYKPTDSGTRQTHKHKNSKDTAITSLIIFTSIAYRISVLFSILMAMLMFGFGLYTVIVYFGGTRPVEGWAPLMGVLSAGFFAIFIVLTLMVKYFDILLRNIFNQQAYLISSIEK